MEGNSGKTSFATWVATPEHMLAQQPGPNLVMLRAVRPVPLAEFRSTSPNGPWAVCRDHNQHERAPTCQASTHVGTDPTLEAAPIPTPKLSHKPDQFDCLRPRVAKAARCNGNQKSKAYLLRPGVGPKLANQKVQRTWTRKTQEQQAGSASILTNMFKPLPWHDFWLPFEGDQCISDMFV